MFRFWDLQERKIIKQKSIDVLHLNAKTSRLLQLVLQKYPEQMIFDASYDYSQTFVINHPEKENVTLEIQFQHTFVKYQRMKNPNEYRYAVLSFTIGKGGEGVVHVSLNTIIANDAENGIEIRVKDKSKKPRAVKCYHNNRSCCEISSPQSNAKDEWQFMNKLSYLGVKPPITENNAHIKAALVMRHIKGGTLRDMIKTHQFTLNELINLTISIIDAVQDLHNRGIIHCDLKPSNIMIGKNGDVFVIDFGISTWKSQYSLGKGGAVGYWPTFPIFMSESRDVYALAVLFKMILWSEIDEYKLSDKHTQRIKSALNSGVNYYSWNRISLVKMREEFESVKREIENGTNDVFVHSHHSMQYKM